MALPYIDCGDCPYLGGCINCNHPDRKAIIVTQLRAARTAAALRAIALNRGAK